MRRVQREKLARVEDPFGVERAFERAHQFDGDGILHLRQELRASTGRCRARRRSSRRISQPRSHARRRSSRPSASDRRPCRAPTGWVTLKWMLPSPTWPNGTGRRRAWPPRRRRRPRAEMPATGDRHRDVVLDRAALAALHLATGLAEAPEARCAARALSRSRRRHEAFSIAVRRASAPSRRADRIGACEASSISTYQAMRSASGSRQPAPCLSTNSMPRRGISSKPVTRCRRARPAPARAARARPPAIGHADEGGLDRARRAETASAPPR